MNFMINLLRLSLTDPNAAGSRILSLRPNLGTALSALVVIIIITVVFLHALNSFKPISLVYGLPKMLPITIVVARCLITLALVWSIWLVAYAFGGSGSLVDGVLIFAWVQVLQLLFLIIQIPLSVLPINFALLAILISIVVLLWVLFGLLNSWLGLNSMWKSAGCFIIGALGMSMGAAFILVSFGFSLEQGAL